MIRLVIVLTSCYTVQKRTYKVSTKVKGSDEETSSPGGEPLHSRDTAASSAQPYHTDLCLNDSAVHPKCFTTSPAESTSPPGNETIHEGIKAASHCCSPSHERMCDICW